MRYGGREGWGLLLKERRPLSLNELPSSRDYRRFYEQKQSPAWSDSKEENKCTQWLSCGQEWHLRARREHEETHRAALPGSSRRRQNTVPCVFSSTYMLRLNCTGSWCHEIRGFLRTRGRHCPMIWMRGGGGLGLHAAPLPIDFLFRPGYIHISLPST